LSTSAAPPALPEAGGTAPSAGNASASPFELFSWLSGQEPTWTSWTIGILVGFLCVVFGAQGIHARWRGEPPDKEKGIPPLPLALGLFVFGVWVLWVFAISRLPG
jgi:hypothetical protein